MAWKSKTVSDAGQPSKVRMTHSLDHLVEMLRGRRTETAWKRGLDVDYATAWKPDALCHEAADEIESLRELLRLVRAERDDLAEKCHAVEKLMSSADIVHRYAGTDGRREWVQTALYLYPGEVLVHMDYWPSAKVAA